MNLCALSGNDCRRVDPTKAPIAPVIRDVLNGDWNTAKMTLPWITERGYLNSQMPLFSETYSWNSSGAGLGLGGGSTWRLFDRCGDGKELSEDRHWLLLALCRERVTCEVVILVLPPMVRSEESLNVTPGILDGVSVASGVRIDEWNAVVHGAVRVNLRLDISIRSATITDGRGVGSKPNTGNVHQGVGSCVRYGNKKCSIGPAFDSARHSLTLNRVSPMVFSPNELALVISTVLLGSPIFSELPYKYTSRGCLQNMPQSAIVWSLKWCSCWNWLAGSRCKMSNLRYITSWRMRRICQNHDL
jgi:hypothetical protein